MKAGKAPRRKGAAAGKAGGPSTKKKGKGGGKKGKKKAAAPAGPPPEAAPTEEVDPWIAHAREDGCACAAFPPSCGLPAHPLCCAPSRYRYSVMHSHPKKLNGTKLTSMRSSRPASCACVRNHSIFTRRSSIVSIAAVRARAPYFEGPGNGLERGLRHPARA